MEKEKKNKSVEAPATNHEKKKSSSFQSIVTPKKCDRYLHRARCFYIAMRLHLHIRNEI